MTIAQELESQQDISKDVTFPPSDLYSDEPPLETELHLQQIVLLLQCLECLWQDRTDYYAAGNLTIYYSPHQKKSEYFRGPDFFVVLGTQRKIRKSWVVWEEYGKYPNVIVEILSESTAKTDKGLKKEIYQDTFRTPNYFWFDPYTLEFAGFNLVDAKYQPLQANAQGHLWSEQLGFYLGIHQGLLRWFTSDGQLVPTPQEAKAQAEQRAEQAQREKQQAQREAEKAQQRAEQAQRETEQARQEAEQARRETERLVAKLRELNIDPDII
ncbi:MAG: Uma2 family endonuclease [Desmonostoc vinosum HA7617-LM4]|jgi:Uma2 family endonuclease|nr:Uma2 family endonuclease [Desmonostoc vinosum HA7617-LM4]